MNEYILFTLVGILAAWVAYLAHRIGDLRSDGEVERQRTLQDLMGLSNRINREFGILDKRLSDVQCSHLSRFEKIEEGLGGKIWRTQVGHARWIALLSTEHLENISTMPGVPYVTLSRVMDELSRRMLDAEWRKTKSKLKRKTK